MTTALIALILATVLPPPWVAPTPTPTPALVWSLTPIVPVATDAPLRARVWLPVVLAAKLPPEEKNDA